MRFPWDPRKTVLTAKRAYEARKAAKKLDFSSKKLPTENMVKQAICSGAEKKQLNTQLMDAVRSGRIRDVRRLLDAGANANVRDNYSAGQENKTALMFAAEKGYTAICRVLINHGAYVNATDIERMTALMEAALGGHTGTCALLLKKGAKPKARDNSNMTALMWAEQNYKDTAEILRREASDETRR